MAISFKGAHFPQDIILMGVRWYVAYPLSYRHVEELMEERGVPVDHATIQRWVVKYSPLLEEAFHRRKRSVWVSWRMDETVVSKSPTEAGVGGDRGADALFCCGKPLGAGRSWGLAVPPLGVGAMARKEGALTQSREGLEGSPDQVVGHRPAV